MKRLLLSGALLCSMPLWAFNVQFFANDASSPAKSVANATKIIFNDDALTVVNTNGESVNVDNSLFDYFKLNAENSSVTEVSEALTNINIEGNILKISADCAISRVAIFAIDGKMMNTVSPNSEDAVISVSNLTPGVYVIIVENAQGKYSKKLIID